MGDRNKRPHANKDAEHGMQTSRLDLPTPVLPNTKTNGGALKVYIAVATRAGSPGVCTSANAAQRPFVHENVQLPLFAQTGAPRVLLIDF